MGMFTNGSGEGLTFAKFNSKIGGFVIKNGKEKTEFSQVRDVKLEKASLRDGDYDGTPYTELLLRVRGEDGPAQISFNIATGACARFVSILNGADLSKPMGFSGQLLKAGQVHQGFGDKPLENDYVSISVFQDGPGYLKPTAEVPKVEMVAIGKSGKEVADTSDRDEFTRNQIALLIAKLGSAPNDADSGNEPPSDEDIPF